MAPVSFSGRNLDVRALGPRRQHTSPALPRKNTVGGRILTPPPPTTKATKQVRGAQADHLDRVLILLPRRSPATGLERGASLLSPGLHDGDGTALTAKDPCEDRAGAA